MQSSIAVMVREVEAGHLGYGLSGVGNWSMKGVRAVSGTIPWKLGGRLLLSSLFDDICLRDSSKDRKAC